MNIIKSVYLFLFYLLVFIYSFTSNHRDPYKTTKENTNVGSLMYFMIYGISLFQI